MENPNHKGHATPKSLREYALFRKQQEMKDINKVKRESIKKEIKEHEDYREPLAIDIEKIVSVCLSTGGDGDGFKFYFESGEDMPYKAFYYWEDWGCYEEIRLTDDERDLVADYYNINEIL